MSKAVHKCRGGENCHDENHMCKIVIRKDFGRVREIVRGAAFYCKKCGRAAHLAENLCDPASI